MCEPVSATTMFYASLAMTAASTAASYVGAQQQANATAEYRNQQFRDAETSANAAFIAQATQENLKLQQDAEKATNDKMNVNLEATQARSRATVAAGEAGVSGVSVDALLADFSRSEARYHDVVDQNLAMEREQSSENLKGMDATRQSRVNSFTPQPVDVPSFFGAALRIGGGAVDAYGRYLAPEDRLKRQAGGG